MSDDKSKKGFSGLSSLASDVDEAVAEQAGRKDQAEKPADTQRQGKPQSSARAAAQTPRGAPPSQSDQEVVASGTLRTPTSSSSGAKWFWGLVGVGVLIWLFNVAQEDGRRPSRTPSYTPPSSSPSYAPSPAPGTQISDLEFSRPPVGDNNVLSVAQIRWCLREDIRIEVLRPLPTTNAQIDQFNAVVADYNSRCGSYRYRQGTLTRAQREVERVRAQIVASVRPPWQASVSPGGSASQRPSVAPAQQRPVQQRPVQQRSQLTLDVQNALTALGYDPGPADGLYGARTRSAIEAYETDVGGRATGIVTRELLDSLRTSLSRATAPRIVERPSVDSVDPSGVTPSERAAIEYTCGWRRSSNGPADYQRCVANEEAELRGLGGRPDLGGISPTDRSSIENTCGWRKNSNGPDDYYRCISQSLGALGDVGERPDLSSLSSVERSSIENTCGWRKNSNGPADYYQCVRAQVTQLSSVRTKPDLSGLSGPERSAIEATCGWRKNSNGPADYYQCVESQRSDLASMRWRPDFSGVSSVDRQAIESTCGWRRNSNGPADYYRCVQQQIGSLR